MVKIGLLGCGTIGSGVVELLAKEACHRNGLSIEKILVRNKDKHNNKPYGSKLTNRFEDILKSDIDIVVEVMGGIDRPISMSNNPFKRTPCGNGKQGPHRKV